MRIQMKYMMASLVVVSSSMLLAGNWTLSGGVLTSSDGQWSFSGASKSGTTLTVGSCTSAAADGILDFRNTVVDGVSIAKLTIPNSAWQTAAIKEFYTDKLSAFPQSLFSGNTTIEKIYCSNANMTKSANIAMCKNCTSLKSFILDGFQFSDFKTECFNGCTALDVDVASIVSSNTTVITGKIFKDCRKLHGKLTLMKYSGELPSAIFNNTGIEEIYICSPVTILNKDCFNGCSSLTNLTLVCSAMTQFGDYGTYCPFKDCTKLEKITLYMPRVNSVGTHNSAHIFSGCTKIKEVTIKNDPFQDSSGNDIMESFLKKHLLYAVPAVTAATDAPKKCILYAQRNLYKPYSVAMQGNYERLYAPSKCYGILAGTSAGDNSSRKAYMAQPPDYKSGMFVSVQ